jgi:pimeloyl-ACP methyl ester carboxylesterase
VPSSNPHAAIVERTVRTPGGAELYVRERGSCGAPTVVLVHGYPDTGAMWDEVAQRLCTTLHVVAYDVRGFGSSRMPSGASNLGLAQLADDLGAVIEAIAPGGVAHLVGHDWGSFQCWEAMTTTGLADRIVSFTGVAGPRIDAAARWIGHRLRADRVALHELAGQLRRSWYIAAFGVPWLPERVLERSMPWLWPRLLSRTEGAAPRPGHPAATIASDAVLGIGLYRQNLSPLRRRRWRGPAPMPVQLIIPLLDRYISPALYAEAGEWASSVRRLELRAGHWAPRTHPDEVSQAILEFVAGVEVRRSED